MKELTIFCPVIKAKIHIESKMLDDIGQFTKFVLWAIGKGYEVNEIDNIIELGEHVILEEITYLCKIGFVIEKNDTYLLTESGISYLKLIDTVEKINSLNILAHINCFTGNVQKFHEKNYDKDELTEDIQALPKLVAKQFFYNKNYANSREFMLENHADLFLNLSESQKESIYTELESEKDMKYVAYELIEIPSADFDFSKDSMFKSNLFLKRTIQKFNYMVRDERLEPYRNVLETLSKIRKFDDELLASKSLEIITWEEEEKRFNAENVMICVDAYKGEIVNSAINNVLMDRKFIIEMPEYQHELNEETVRKELKIDNIHWSVSNTTIEKTNVFQLIPFELFIEKNEEDGDEWYCSF